MIEVAAFDEQRQPVIVTWPIGNFEIVDGCLLLIDNQTVVAAYAEGVWSTVRRVPEDED